MTLGPIEELMSLRLSLPQKTEIRRVVPTTKYQYWSLREKPMDNDYLYLVVIIYNNKNKIKLEV